MAETSIQWCDYTFNPWWGCVRVSPGCEHCYAEKFSHRLGLNLWGPTATRRGFDDKHWSQPIKWAARRAKGDPRHRVFCASMADVFEDNRTLDLPRHRLWNLIDLTPELTWQILTKRPENIDKLARGSWVLKGWPKNVWLGVTAEDQQLADERIPVLLRQQCAVRFVSYEPALGPVDFRPWLCQLPRDPDHLHLASLDQIIVGGESGPGARPCDFAWIRSVLRQCWEHRVAAFVKQVGARPIGAWGWGDPPTYRLTDITVNPPRESIELAQYKNGVWRLSDRKGGSMSEWPADLRVREFPA